MAGSLDGLYFTRDRFAVTQGRMPDPSRAGRGGGERALGPAPQASVSATGSRSASSTPPQEDAVYSDDPPPPVDRLEVTVVGIGLFPDEVVQDDTDRVAAHPPHARVHRSGTRDG